VNTLEARIKALEEELARLRALLPAPTPPPPSPPSAWAAIAAPDGGPEVPLEDLTGYRVSLSLVCEAVALLGLWPFRPDGTMRLTREEADQVSRLVAAYREKGLSWAKGLEALGITPPPVEDSLRRLTALGRLLQAATPVLGEAIAGSDLPPPIRDMGRRMGRLEED